MSDKPHVDPYLLGAEPPPGARRSEDRPPEKRPKRPTRAQGAAGPGTRPEPPGAGGGSDGLASALAPTTAPFGPVVGELLPPSPVFPPRKRTRLEKHLQLIAAQDRGLRRESARIVLDSFATFDLPDDGSKPEGWSDRKYRTARLARLPDKDAPSAIRHAARILESYRRSEALEDRKPSPTLNCDIQVFVRQEINSTYNYEVQEVKGDE